MNPDASTVRLVHVPERYTVAVLLPGAPKPILIEGRTGMLIGWLVQHRARIERVGVGSLVLNLGLGSFTPEIHEHFPRQAAIREDPDVAEP